MWLKTLMFNLTLSCFKKSTVQYDRLSNWYLVTCPPLHFHHARGSLFLGGPCFSSHNSHVIPLISKFPKNDESSYTPLTHVVPLGGDNTEKCKYNVPIVSTSDVETLCCDILDIQDVSAGARLSLTTGPLKFTYY